MPSTKKIILFEYDKPFILADMLNYAPGIWFWVLTADNIIVTDDNGETGYYNYNNATIYTISSLVVGDVSYVSTLNYNDMYATNESFYYDSATTRLYIHFDNFNPPLDKIIKSGAAYGSIKGSAESYVYNSFYYRPDVLNFPSIKKEKDPLTYGFQKFGSGEVTLINTDGEYDDWRTRNMFSQAARILVGDYDAEYHDFEKKFSGFVENDSRTFETISITVQDTRKNLTQPIATNTLNQTDWPNLPDDKVDTVKPVAYGDIFNAECICLNEEESSPTYYTFLLCDTEYNQVESGSVTVYMEGAVISPYDIDYAAGTFRVVAATVEDNLSDVTADFTVDIKNGVDIILDLIYRYDFKPLAASFWDIDEVTTAKALSRDTSIYIDDDDELKDIIKNICFDIDALFFIKDDGLYSIRIFDTNRTIAKEIKTDEWTGDPTISNQGDEFLTSCIIKYKKNQSEDKYSQYENNDYKSDAFNIYKKYRSETFETNLTTLADAQAKSETIMEWSSDIQDIITRATVWDHSDLEIMDFVLCSPTTRQSQADAKAVYEVLGVQKDFDNLKVTLTLRYIKADPNLYLDYFLIVDENGVMFADENDNLIAGAQ